MSVKQVGTESIPTYTPIAEESPKLAESRDTTPVETYALNDTIESASDVSCDLGPVNLTTSQSDCDAIHDAQTQMSIEGPLHRNGFAGVTHHDVEDVHARLDGLSPEDYAATLDRLDNSGLLDRYVRNMSDEQQDAFVQQMVRQGATGRSEAVEVQGNFDPPAIPSFVEAADGLPEPAREAIMDHNVRAGQAYVEDYQDYVDRYIDAVEVVPDLATLVGDYGPVVPSADLRVGGLNLGRADLSSTSESARPQLRGEDRGHVCGHRATS